MHKYGIITGIILAVVAMVPGLISTGCASPTANTATYTVPQLKYLLIARYPDLFWCDPDLYPVAREGQEQQNALQQFTAIQSNEAEFTAILDHLAIPVTTGYTDEEKLLIYRQYKLLTYGLELSGTSSPYSYTLRTGQNKGYRISGTITANGTIKELTKTATFNTCPICLSKGTLIDTPAGPVPVEDLKQGMPVWTQDGKGQKIEAALLRTAKTPVPPGFEMVKITLSDDRSVTASPGHPSAALKALGDYRTGDKLDGASVASVDHVPYDGGYTYDILPAGGTGTYWANGILLKSTIGD